MRTAFITGATSGIGRATALALARAGYETHAAGRNEAALESLRAEHGNIVPLAIDITDRDSLESVLAGLEVDVLVNNAGIMPPLGNFADMAMSDIDAVLEVNLSAPIILTRMVLPGMRSRRSGHILFVGSSAGHAAFPNIAAYSATKAAVAGFASALRADVAAFGVRVTEIVPGRVETQLYKDILGTEARAAMYAGGVALQPEDVADMIAAVVALPARADVTRFDIVPTRPTPPAGGK